MHNNQPSNYIYCILDFSLKFRPVIDKISPLLIIFTDEHTIVNNIYYTQCSSIVCMIAGEAIQTYPIGTLQPDVGFTVYIA